MRHNVGKLGEVRKEGPREGTCLPPSPPPFLPPPAARPWQRIPLFPCFSPPSPHLRRALGDAEADAAGATFLAVDEVQQRGRHARARRALDRCDGALVSGVEGKEPASDDEEGEGRLAGRKGLDGQGGRAAHLRSAYSGCRKCGGASLDCSGSSELAWGGGGERESRVAHPLPLPLLPPLLTGRKARVMQKSMASWFVISRFDASEP